MVQAAAAVAEVGPPQAAQVVMVATEDFTEIRALPVTMVLELVLVDKPGHSEAQQEKQLMNLNLVSPTLLM